MKLDFLNKSIINEKFRKLKINFRRSKLETDYYFQDDLIYIQSKNSFIGTNKFNYNGNINLDPFDFKISSEIEKFNFKKFLPNKSLFDEIFSKEFLLNENFNGKIALKSNNLTNSNFFNEIFINSNYVGEKIDLSNSRLINKKIGELYLDFGNIYLEEGDLLFKGKFNFKIFDKKKFYRKFLVSKKNQKNIENIYFGLNLNLTDFNTKIFFMSLDKDKPKVNDELDDLIYNFNNKSITVNNWISLRSFVNKIISSYSG